LGREEGRQIGRREALRKIVVKLQDQGMQPEEIAELVDCSPDEVRAFSMVCKPTGQTNQVRLCSASKKTDIPGSRGEFMP
jgi:hypothetical protein